MLVCLNYGYYLLCPLRERERERERADYDLSGSVSRYNLPCQLVKIGDLYPDLLHTLYRLLNTACEES